MAYSEAARVTENTKRITTTGSVQTARAAINTFGEAIDAVFTTYDLPDQDQQHVRDKIVDICRFIDAAMQ